TREGFLPNPKEKYGVKSLDVDISEHSEVSDGFERFRNPKKKQTRRKPMFRNIGYTKQHLLYQVSNTNFGPAIGFRLMKQIYGGFDMVGVTVNECKNRKKKISVFIGDRDAQMAVEKLISQKLHYPGFYANYYKGDDDRLVGLFWADEEAIKNYAKFWYQMVFVPFVGINHHNRCITFASGLLADETVDPSMKIAIAECFPDTRHRLCMWYIMMKLGTKVGATLCNTTDFKRRIYDIVWTDQISLEIFKREWECVINDFELGENKWLGDMFDLKESWIHVYLTDVHMAGLMRTTSRFKSENYFLAYQKENEHDLRYKTPAFKTDLPLKKEACKLYTRTLFFDVQDEMFTSYKYCIALSVVQTENTKTYSVRDTQYHIFKGLEQFLFYQVKFCKSEMKLHCSYNRYEAYGLLCRHGFYVLRMNNVNEFPKNYLHKRWLKNVKPSSFDRHRITGASDVVRSEVLELYKIFESSIDRLVHDLDNFHIYKDKMKEVLNQAEIDVPTVLKVNSKAVMSVMLGVDEPEKVLTGNPNLSKVKAIGCFSRMKPVAKVTAEELAKRRTCGLCGGKEGHNKRTYTNEPASKKPKVQASLK
nr:FAR1 DNA binding domain, zinc finger, SWIM-type, MULE transposase domain, FHY3/FAR1 family [Tanacetum cinerariifolium]